MFWQKRPNIYIYIYINMNFFLCNVAWASGTTLHKVFPVERCPRNIVQDFSYAMLSGVSWTIFHRFLTCAMLSQSIKTTLNRIFSCQCCLQPLEQLCIGFWHLQCFPRVLRQHWTGFFPVQCCLEPLEQHYIGFFLCKGVPGVLKDNISQPLRQHCKGFWSV